MYRGTPAGDEAGPDDDEALLDVQHESAFYGFHQETEEIGSRGKVQWVPPGIPAEGVRPLRNESLGRQQRAHVFRLRARGTTD